MVVDHCGEKVVCRADGVEVTREMKVDILHGNDLRVAAACRTALDTENGTERGLSESNDGFFADSAETVCETYGRRGFSFACGGGGDRRNEDQLTVGLVRFIQKRKIDFCFVLSVLLEIIVRDARDICDLGDRTKLGRLCNFNISFHFLNSFLIDHPMHIFRFPF